ncbi:MAG: putative redox protein [Parasphingorhabdus sp.]|jgi:putative redox protein
MSFKAIYEKRQQLFKDEPDNAVSTVRASSELVEAFRSVIKVRDFEVVIDQPKGMGSSNQGPRPSEYVLAALAACHEVTYRLYADAMEIPLESVSVSVEGVADARGFFGPDEDIPAGFSTIRGEINIQSSATDEQLDQLRQAVNKHCPVLDDLIRPVDVKLDLIRTNAQ